MAMEIAPVTLEGSAVRLEPLSLSHHAELCKIGLDFELWHWTTTNVRTPAEMRAYIETALAEQARGTSLPFATIDQASGKVIGSTRYLNIDASNLRVEIGATWIAKDWQRTAANTEAKYLMLRHAFRFVRRVVFLVGPENLRSQRAVERIGAVLVGHSRDGAGRESLVFAITAAGWIEP